MSVEFSNAYQDILLDNLTSVIKQNILFQTQLKLTEKILTEKDEILKQNYELQEKLNDAMTRLTQLIEKEREYEIIKNSADQLPGVVNEKNRIQQALNESLQTIESQKNTINHLNNEVSYKISEIENLRKQLEEFVAKVGEEQQKNSNLTILIDDLNTQITEQAEKIKNISTVVPQKKEKTKPISLKTTDGSSF